jgi:hypothetical protein
MQDTICRSASERTDVPAGEQQSLSAYIQRRISNGSIAPESQENYRNC